MRKLALLLLLLSPPLAQAVFAQTSLTVAPRHCVWREGDNPDGKLGWAVPVLDEYARQPVANWSGLLTPTPRFWLRCQFQPGDLSPAFAEAGWKPVLQVSGDLAYEAFIDGQPLGGSGDVLTGEHTVGVVRQYASPAFARHAFARPGQPIVVALRMTFTPEIVEQQPLPLVTLGGGHVQNVEYVALVDGRVRAQWLTWVCYALIASAGPLFLALFWFDRTQRYLLWIGLTCLSLATLRANELLWAASVHYPSRLEGFLNPVGEFLGFFQIEFFFALNRRRVTRFFRVIQALLLLNSLTLLVAAFLPVDWSMRLNWVFDISARGAFIDLLSLLLGCLAPVFAFRPLRNLRGGQIAMFAVCSLWQLADAAIFAVQLPFSSSNFLIAFQRIQPYRSVAIAAVIVALTLLIVQRLRADNRQRAMLEGEMQAARQIQQMLISAILEVAPGLRIEAAFRPAKEVGGDFYRCRVLPGGTQRVLLGDVSGKGSAAAMTAAMLLGAAEGHDGDSPSGLLAHLNAAFKHSGLGGFATCLCLDVVANGTVGFANAGQIPPYRMARRRPANPACRWASSTTPSTPRRHCISAPATSSRSSRTASLRPATQPPARSSVSTAPPPSAPNPQRRSRRQRNTLGRTTTSPCSQSIESTQRMPLMRSVLLGTLLFSTLSCLAQSGHPAPPPVRYHYGDDPAWSKPTLDDADWAIAPGNIIPAPPERSDGFLWVRIRFPVPPFAAPGSSPLTLRLARLANQPGVAELFANGSPLGGWGATPPHPQVWFTPPQSLFPLPQTTPEADATVLVAARMWVAPQQRGSDQPLRVSFRLESATTATLADGYLHQRIALEEIPDYAICLFVALLGIALAGLSLIARRRVFILSAVMLLSFASGEVFFSVAYSGVRPLTVFR